MKKWMQRGGSNRVSNKGMEPELERKDIGWPGSGLERKIGLYNIW